MFDFRYHALSLVAVFLALGIGILLGATIGDSLVSAANQDLHSSLQNDVVSARQNARDLRTQVDRRDQLLDRVEPVLVNGRLKDRRVSVVAFGALPGNIESAVRQSVELAGGRLDSISVLQFPPDVQGLDAAISDLAPVVGGKFSDPKLAGTQPGSLGQTLGQAVVSSTSVAHDLQRSFPNRFRGDFAGGQAVVFYGLPAPAPQQPSAALEDGVVSGLKSTGAPVVGVEDASTQPSQTPYYQAHGLASVDSVNLSSGQLALVYALNGARGSFGFKDTADKPIPELPPQGG